MNTESKSVLLEKGDVLNGKWEILEHIATGGMAEVYRARQIRLDREVVIKVLSEKFLATFEGEKEEIEAAVKRFHREGTAMAKVRHPNVLQVFDHDSAVILRDGDELAIDYIVVEYIPGPNLRSTMPPEGLRGSEKGIQRWIHKYFIPILQGLETVHAMGIVHRDLKPENVLLDGVVPKIMDFGLAGGPRWRGLTESHHMFGTISYMAPEQFMDMAETDSRADIYSLCKIFYEALSGTMSKQTTFPLKTAHLENPDTPLLKRLDRVIQQATAEDRNQRTPSTAILRQAIMEALQGDYEADFRPKEPTKIFGVRRPRLLMAVIALIIAASIGFHLLYHREKTTPEASSVQPSVSGPTQDQLFGKAKADAQPPTPQDSVRQTLEGKDGATLRRVPPGEVTVIESIGPQPANTVRVDSFYMDETEVTNHQYVEFLNQILPEIRVEEGVVSSGGEISLLLGEVKSGYEPIVFKDGRFYVKDPALLSHPVVRVTGYGAAAYARFYGRRLPTEKEWLHALGGKGQFTESPFRKAPEPSRMMHKMHMQMEGSSSNSQSPSQIPTPVSLFEPNAYGIRGLDGNVNEWGFRLPRPLSNETEEPEYVILGGFGSDPEELSALGPGIGRHPWEAFENVGFRCVLQIQRKEN
jgi:serine/threonine-protein kinase